MNPIGPVNALYPMPTTLVGATVNGKPNFNIDIEALRPLLFDMAGKKYWSLGPAVGNCWSAGKALKKERDS